MPNGRRSISRIRSGPSHRRAPERTRTSGRASSTPRSKRRRSPPNPRAVDAKGFYEGACPPIRTDRRSTKPRLSVRRFGLNACRCSVKVSGCPLGLALQPCSTSVARLRSPRDGVVYLMGAARGRMELPNGHTNGAARSCSTEILQSGARKRGAPQRRFEMALSKGAHGADGIPNTEAAADFRNSRRRRARPSRLLVAAHGHVAKYNSKI
mmetsp:Transcript_27009/g.55551  ORF Transcript_27009/g.55551 Transcript_27009/m.55551 type:complete len:210 (-) Transcript_27009:23-652(-)